MPSEVAGRGRGADAVAPVKPRLRGVSHEVAAFVFPALGLLLVLLAPANSRVPVVIYTAGVTAMYATSACYHRGSWSVSSKQRMRRLDHSMILIGIAATYTPIASIGLDASTARPLLAAVWGLAAGGIVIRNVWFGAPRWVVPTLYIAVGWTALAVIPALWNQLGWVTCALLLLGGLTYSLGAVVYGRRRPDPAPAIFGYHEVFHALVLLAGLIFYAAVARVAITA
ncbi:MAG: hemolysin [Actinomycetota bacterium]|nr:hemolysin [Actinomycetota bacterium]